MAKRATVYFEEPVHKALRLKAAETEQSVSDLVNDAVRRALAEDADDLGAFRFQFFHGAGYLLFRQAAAGIDKPVIRLKEPPRGQLYVADACLVLRPSTAQA